jgi:uncharacterized protein YaaQ
MDNMVMAIIPRDEGEMVLNALIDEGHTATFIETKGGVMRQSQYTLFIVVPDKHLEKICKIIQSNCKVDMLIEGENEPLEGNEESFSSNKLGGAVVFVWKLNRILSY